MPVTSEEDFDVEDYLEMCREMEAVIRGYKELGTDALNKGMPTIHLEKSSSFIKAHERLTTLAKELKKNRRLNLSNVLKVASSVVGAACVLFVLVACLTRTEGTIIKEAPDGTFVKSHHYSYMGFRGPSYNEEPFLPESKTSMRYTKVGGKPAFEMLD